MSDPRFPDVPFAVGVPPVLRLFEPSSTAELTADAPDASSDNSQPSWGVFDQGGAQAVEPDNIVRFDYSGEYTIADFPLEQGAFASYDKVALPFDVSLLMTKGGSIADRTTFLQSVETLRTSLDLYNVVTPERTYMNVNAKSVSYSRVAQAGANLIAVQIQFVEIRETVTADYSNSKEPSGAATVNGGTVQTQDPPPNFAPVLEPST